MINKEGNQEIALALGGGAAYGAAHLGILKALEEKEVKIHSIAGTSIGALIASFVAFGKEWDEIYELTKDVDWFDISNLKLSRYAILSNQKLGSFVVDCLGDVDIADSEIPLFIVATDVVNGDKVSLKKGDLSASVMASCAIPGIFEPIEINGKTLVDGGLVENIPISPLIEHGPDRPIMCVDLNARTQLSAPSNVVEVVLNSFHLAMKNMAEMQTRKADLIIKPDLAEFKRTDLNRTDQMMELGYEEAMKCLERFQK